MHSIVEEKGMTSSRLCYGLSDTKKATQYRASGLATGLKMCVLTATKPIHAATLDIPISIS